MYMLINIYLICLLFGILYAFLSALMENLFARLNFDYGFKVLTLPINTFTIVTFVTAFGSTGLIVCRFLPGFLSSFPAILAGHTVAKFLHKSFYLKNKKREFQITKDLPKEATVVSKIPPNGCGKISYTMGDVATLMSAQEKISGNGIPEGRKVTILEVKDNVCYVVECAKIIV